MSELVIVVLKMAQFHKAVIRASLIASFVFRDDAFAQARSNENDGLGQAYAARQATSQSDKPTQIPSEPQSIPFELKDNLVRIEVTVNGQRQSGVLDSGAATFFIDHAVSRKLGLREGATVGDAAGAGHEVKQLLPITITKLLAGPLQFENTVGYSMDLGHLSSSVGFPVDVLVGAPAFKSGAVEVDYPGRRITFGRPGRTPKCDAPIPLEIAHDVPIVEIELRTTSDAPPVRLKVMVDLGTRHAALVLGGPFTRSEAGRALIQRGIAKQIGQGIGGKVQGTAARVAEVRVGPMNFRELETNLTSEIPAFEAGIIDGTLGVPLWDQGAITFDYPAAEICIDISDGTGRDPHRGR